MEIVFLGTGGGRWNLISQARRTGGFRINGSIAIHVDPGPGALIACHDFRQDPRKVGLLVVTHNHIDHVNDAGVIAEAMSGFALEKKGWLIGSRSVILGDEKGDRGISSYHMGALARVIVAKPGKKISIAVNGKKASLTPTRTKHDDKTGIGFVLEMDGQSLGYTSDTEYFYGISDQYRGCDVLIANNLKAKKDGVPGHLFTSHTIRLFQEAQPKLGIITHLGMRLIRAGAEKEAKKIQKASGVRTIAAKDGMRVDLAAFKTNG
ncbi:TPA: MBL fold metallo-hydrolase [Candidatus Micrarchaeota archaeon]|nr:MBL fold metallo-hydrolase [Candidatus Micrarchaeota archaeon]HIH31040.1 MBL fold metallo-hydrolase [Candidatus Micrarchaeota archaeon]